MKHWSFYTRVVTYLEKVEAFFPEKRKGAYLLWRDDDSSPLMIAGPGADCFKRPHARPQQPRPHRRLACQSPERK